MSTGPHAVWYLALLLPLLIILSIWYYRRTVPDIPAGGRRVLLTLRLLGLAALALALARPVLEWEDRESGPASWVRLVDYSASMDRPDGAADGSSRLAVALSLLDNDAWTRHLPGVELETAFFADSAAADTTGLPREGTDLTRALEQYRRLPFPPAAVVVLSDGATNSASDPTAVEWPFPVYSICLGDSGMATDRALIDIDAPASAIAGDTVSVSIRLQSTGEPDRAVVTFQAGEDRQNRTEPLAGGGRQQELEFSFVPDTSGIYRLAAQIAAERDEAVTDNNRIESQIYIEPRRRRALVLASAPDWETAFMNRRISDLERFELDVRYRRFTEQGSYPRWPATYDSLISYDAIVLTDMPSVEWVGLATPLNRYLREHGGGLLFILGPRAAARDWSTVQSGLVPLEWTAQPPGVVSVIDPVTLTASGRYHPVTGLGEPERAARLWGDLPLLSGVVPARPGSGAVSLVETRTGTIAWPVLLAGERGRGRALVTLGYPLWRWDFALAGTPDKTAWASPFWRAALRWLTSSRAGERLSAQLLEDPLPALSAPQISALLLDESWQPESRAAVAVEVRDEAGELVQTFDLGPQGAGRYGGRGRPLPAGEYSYVVRALRDTLVVARTDGRFTATSVSREALAPAARPGVLDGVAAATGGTRWPVSDWERSLDSLPREPVTMVSYSSLRVWESFGLLIIVILLFGSEWILRRRYQML